MRRVLSSMNGKEGRMEIYIVNKVAIKAKQMKTDFILENEDRCFYGRTGDYIIHQDGKQIGCRRSDFENRYMKASGTESVKQEFIRMMEQGYKDMAKINLEIANEMAHLEEEVRLVLQKVK